MIYPNPPNIENGTIEIIGRDGNLFTLSSDSKPAVLLADVGVLKHRGIPPKGRFGRPAIEITLVPAVKTRINIEYFGQNVRVPFLAANDFSDAWAFYSQLSAQVHPRQVPNTAGSRDAALVNIGGGRRFDCSDWINFDAASPKADCRLNFSTETIFPYPSEQAQIVYSSHCLEHLPDEVVGQLLSEARRIVRADGHFVVKLPDFTRVLTELKAGVHDGILNPKLWGLVPLFDMWVRNNIQPSPDQFAAMILCGFWTAEYGEEFMGTNTSTDAQAYHGPPRIAEATTKRILRSSESPHFVASLLRAEVVRTERAPRFNHQNAWSFNEFVSVADAYGFELVTQNNVCESFAHIPTVADMKDISQYYVFKKKE